MDCVFCTFCEGVHGIRSVSRSPTGSHSSCRSFVPIRTWQQIPLLGVGNAEKFHQALLFGGQHRGVGYGDPLWQRRLPVLWQITLQVGPCSSTPGGRLSCRGPARLTGGAITPASALPRASQRSRGSSFSPAPPGDRDLPPKISIRFGQRYRRRSPKDLDGTEAVRPYPYGYGPSRSTPGEFFLSGPGLAIPRVRSVFT